MTKQGAPSMPEGRPPWGWCVMQNMFCTNAVGCGVSASYLQGFQNHQNIMFHQSNVNKLTRRQQKSRKKHGIQPFQPNTKRKSIAPNRNPLDHHRNSTHSTVSVGSVPFSGQPFPTIPNTIEVVAVEGNLQLVGSAKISSRNGRFAPVQCVKINWEPETRNDWSIGVLLRLSCLIYESNPFFQSWIVKTCVRNLATTITRKTCFWGNPLDSSKMFNVFSRRKKHFIHCNVHKNTCSNVNKPVSNILSFRMHHFSFVPLHNAATKNWFQIIRTSQANEPIWVLGGRPLA